MKKEKKIMSRLLACGLAAILPVASGMSVRAEESGESSSDAGKEETVYIFTDADGNPEKTVVSNWLKNPDGSKTLKDSSDLSDIKNVEGDETYTQSGNQLTWQADGSDIYYQGTTSKQAPVSVKLSYQLDGKDISSDDLAGKSGHVKIRFDYENNATKTVTVGGKREEVKVPFAMVSGIILPVDNFKNVTVTNGRVLSEGKSNIVVGMAFPGLKESLNVDSASFKNNIGDYNIPEYVEIEADATDFSLGMTLTVASTDVISQLKDAKDGKIDTSSITDSINELTDASQQLVDGAQSLKDGTAQLRSGANDLVDGAGKLKDGANELSNGMNTLSSSLASNRDSNYSAYSKDLTAAQAAQAAMTKQMTSLIDPNSATAQQTINQINTMVGAMQSMGLINSDQTIDQEKLTALTKLAMSGMLQKDGNLTGDLQTLMLETGIINAGTKEYDPAAVANLKTVAGTGILTTNGSVQPELQTLMAMAGILTDGKYNDDAAKNLVGLASTGMLTTDGSIKPELQQMMLKTGILKAVQTDSGTTYQYNEKAVEALATELATADNLKKNGILTDTGIDYSALLQSMVVNGVLVQQSDGSYKIATTPTSSTGDQSNGTQTTNTPATVSSAKAAMMFVDEDDDADNSDDAVLEEQKSDAADTTASVESTDTTEQPEADDKDAQIAELEKQLADEQQKSADLQTELNQVTSENEDLQARLKQATSENERLQASLNQATSDNKALQDELAAAKSAQAQPQDKGDGNQNGDPVKTSSMDAGDYLVTVGNETTDGSSTTGTTDTTATSAGAVTVQQFVSAIMAAKLTDSVTDLVTLYSKAYGEYGAYQALNTVVSDNDFKKLVSGGSSLASGAGSLYDGSVTLRNGINEVDDGAQELLDGMQKFDSEGIQKLADVFGDDLGSVIDRLDAVMDAGADYTSFTGSGNANDSVKFVIKTSEVGTDSAN